ncbi:12361_t:CDS:10 [Racocetra fulgida]|uniref:12361_t:CDS:1 n=1 Tax=Racocetra fulgida TaxID=60492 RepID=A0A9N8ZFD2_9GLOM|nr:12361_t:CDS:10 [Racocetra fulgida]
MSSKQRRMDHSDDEGTHHSRDKFTRERRSSLDHRDRSIYNERRVKRDNNSSPEDRDRRSKRRRSISPDSRRPQQLEGDHYIPNYEKDGYTPAPRYVGRPGDMRFPPHGFPVGLSLEPLKDPDQLDFLMSNQNQKTRYTDDDLHKKYNDYKEAFGIKQLKTFFEAHKKEEWFLEKYHPKYMEPRIAATKELKKKNYQNFITDLKRGLLDNIVNDVEENKDDTKTEDKNEQDEDANRLFIKSVSPNISRQKIEEMCKEIPGFKYLALSEPNPQKKFHRLGWIVFEEGSDMDAAYEKLNEQKIDEFVFYLARHKNQTGPVRNRTTPDAANTLERLKKDLEMAIKLSEKLDKDVDNTMTGSQNIKQRLILIDDGHRREEINNARFYNNYVLDPNHLLPTTPPNPTAALVPQSVTPIPPSPFPVMTNAPPPPFMNFSFPIMGAAAGTPHDQIPRIGFDGRDDSRERGSRQTSDSRRQSSRPNDLNAGSDPRQVKSYVDLDAPAEGDIEIKY